MAAAAVQPDVKAGPPMVEVKNIFFKAFPAITFFADESEADAIENSVAFQNFNRSLECSSKHGCVLLTFNNAFYLCRVSDMLGYGGGGDARCFNDVKKMVIRNEALPIVPNILALSTGEDFLAVDTYKGDSAWVIVFKLEDFLNQGGTARPFCEIRCSTTANSRIRAIAWNPGEGMTNLVAINTGDGALFLAKMIGPNNVELSKLPSGGIRCCCWSPKGKQLVVGRMNGNLSQLKLDLTEAKAIPGPQPGHIPASILWTQTTQFLVVFHNGTFIDFMQLDVPKGAAPTYTNSNDIFISEEVPATFSCFFVPLMSWNVVISMTNSASDVVVLVKQVQSSGELWVPGDITDNRRAAFLLDNYARGAAVFYGSENPVTFSEVESYQPMPIMFLLSQRGSISMYSVINCDPQAGSLNVKVSSPVPESAFAVTQPSTPAFSPAPTSQAQAKSIPQAQPSLFQGSQPLFQNLSRPVPATTQPQTVQSVPPQAASSHAKPVSPFTLQVDQSTVKPKNLFGSSQPLEPRQLGTSTLPTIQDMAGLQKAVEEKRREMTTKLEQKASLKGLEDDEQCTFVVTEVRKMEQRLEEFKDEIETSRTNLNKVVGASFDVLEKRVLPVLNVVEDFTSDMVSTTSAQKEEVDMLKERILSHFSQLEYAKSLVERSRDPRYIEHLRSRPLDPASQQKFEDLQKLHNYLRVQVAECRRHFYDQSRKPESPLDRVSYPQLIYITLSNHSKIIRRLKTELDNMKERLGLGRHSQFEDSDYLAVCEASCASGKKGNSVQEYRIDPDEITLNDLTAGITRVKLNKETDRPDRRPVRFSNRKLCMFKNSMPDVKVVKVKAEESNWVRSPAKTGSRPKPMAYQTPSVDNAKPAITDSGFSGSKPVESALQSTSFVVKKEPTQPLNFPKTTHTIGANLFSSVPSASFGLDLSSGIKPTPANANVSAKNAHVATSKAAFSVPQGTSILKASLQAPSPVSSASPAVQLPTLAGLLATPVPSTSSSLISNNLFSSAGSGASKPIAASSDSSKDDKGSMFGSGNFSFGSPSFGAKTASTSVSTTGPTTTPNTSFLTAGVAPNASVSSFGFSSQSNPVTSTTNTGLFGTGGVSFSSKSPSLSVTSLPQGSKSESSSTTSSSSTVSTVSNPSFVPSKGSDETSNKPAFGTGFSVNLSSGSLFSSNTPTSGIFGGSGDFKVSVKPTAEASPVPKGTSSISLSAASNESKNVVSEGDETVKTSSDGVVKPQSTTATTFPANLFGGPPAVPFGSVSLAATVTSSTTPTSASTTKSVVSADKPSNQSSVATITPVPNISSNVASTNLFSPIPTTKPGDVSSPAFTAAAGANVFTPVTISGGLFSSVPVTTTSQSLFGAVTSVSASTTSVGAFSVASTPVTTQSGGLFSTTPTTSSSTGLLGSAPNVTTTSAGTFGASLTTTATSSAFQPATATGAPAGVFGNTTPTGPGSGLFSTTIASSASAGVFSSVPPTTSASTGGLFGSSGFFSSTTTTPSTVPGTGFMSALSISDPNNKPAITTSAPPSGLFSSSPFGGSTATSGASIFGGGSVFGGQSSTAGATANTGSTTQSGFGAFGAKPATGAFGTQAASGSSSVFGGSATFGSPTAFGSAFGSSGSSAFGASGTSVFGNAAASTTQPAGFGALSQQGTATTSPFGGSPFGGASAQQQQGSLFGTPQKSATGLFSSNFGTPTSTSSSGVFGQSSSVFGSPTGSGTFSAGATQGGVAQQGFGFGQAKPTTGSAFGSPPSFGGSATFGQTSPFGSSFGASPSSTPFGSGGTGSVFGGSGTAAATGFGNLAQQTGTTQGFGGGFGAAPQSPQQASVFGSPQQAKPSTFGGNAFSSWR